MVNLFSLGLAGLNIAGGLTGGKSASGVAKEQRKTAALQYEYNKKEIDRAYEYNLVNMMRDYSTQNLNATKEAEKMLGQANLQLGNQKGVEESSFDEDMLTDIESDLADKQRALIETQMGGYYELANLRASQLYSVSKDYSSMLGSINNNEAAQKSKYNQMLFTGIAQAGTIGQDWLENREGGAK